MPKCETCGASFSSQPELARHGREHVKTQQGFKCDTCGASFKSQTELMQHAGKHKVIAC